MIVIVALSLILSFSTVIDEQNDKQALAEYQLAEEQKRLTESYTAYKLKLVKVTAYAPHDNKSGICGGGLTSLGKEPEKDIIAVDPKEIPYGTRVYIPGYGESIAGDTGPAIRSYEGIAIDVYMPTYKEAIQWGVKYVWCAIYE